MIIHDRPLWLVRPIGKCRTHHQYCFAAGACTKPAGGDAHPTRHCRQDDSGDHLLGVIQNMSVAQVQAAVSMLGQ
jgi:hypothetical protein